MTNSITNKANVELINFLPKTVIEKYGWILLMAPVAVYSVDKISKLIDKAIDKGCGIHLKIQGFEERKSTKVDKKELFDRMATENAVDHGAGKRN